MQFVSPINILLPGSETSAQLRSGSGIANVEAISATPGSARFRTALPGLTPFRHTKRGIRNLGLYDLAANVTTSGTVTLNDQTPYTATSTISRTGTTSSSASSGASSVAVTGFSSETPPEGIQVKFANHNTVYTIGSGGSSTSIPLRTTLTSSVPSGTAVALMNIAPGIAQQLRPLNGGPTYVRATGLSGAVTFSPSTWLTEGDGINVENGAIHHTFSFQNRPVSVTYHLDLFSSGSPGAIPSDYHRITYTLDNCFQTHYALANPRRWMHVGTHSNDMTVVGAGADLTNIIGHRITVQPASGTAVIYCPGRVDFVPEVLDKGVLILNFHKQRATSGNPSTGIFSQRVFGNMLKNHLKGQTFCLRMTEVTGTFGEVNLQDLREMHQSGGWGVAPHSAGREMEKEMDLVQWAAERVQAFELAPTLGFMSARDTCFGSGVLYFFNQSQTDFIEIAKTLGCRSIHNYIAAANGSVGDSTKPFTHIGGIWPAADPYNIPALSAGIWTTGDMLPNWLAYTQQTIDNKGVNILTFHDEMMDTSAIRDAFDLFLPELKALVESGDLIVGCFDDLPW